MFIYLISLIIAIVLICITKACCSDKNKIYGPSSKNKSPADVQRLPSEEDYRKGRDLVMFELETANANKWF